MCLPAVVTRPAWLASGILVLSRGIIPFRGALGGNIDYINHVGPTGVHDWWMNERPLREQGYATHLITQHALSFVAQHADEPFCLYVPYTAPHHPHQGPADGPVRVEGRSGGDPWEPRWVERARTEEIEALDAGVGQIVDAVSQLGLAEHTLIFFLSDNGADRWGDNGPLRGFRLYHRIIPGHPFQGKATVWEGGLRVPLIAWYPGHIQPGRVIGDLTCNLDLMPTMLGLAGAAPPADHVLDGLDLTSLLLGEEAMPALEARTLFWDFPRLNRDTPAGQQAVRRGPWKLIINAKGQLKLALYNLDDDIGEQENLAAVHPDRVRAMRSAFQTWRSTISGH